MSQTSDNNKRIAKNVSFLYFRMIFLLCVGLYTSRIVLNSLGVSDFGIYNVVGGVVAMFSFINGSMGTATTRFLTFELGKKSDSKQMRLVFSTALLIHIGICVLVLILAETVGLWYVYNVLVVPPERFASALIVYQISVLTSLVGVISVPYNAALISHEKMGAFAYISIFEAIANLLVAYSISHTHLDRLIVYSVLLMLIQMLLRIIYGVYCSRHFSETQGAWMFDKAKFKEMYKFAIWIMNGAIALLGYTQGLNLLLNFFFGPTINAARGIAVNVQTKLAQFCTNFQTAINPQITKSYANGDLKYMHQLVFNASKYSMILMFLLSFPIFVESKYILKIWLGVVPEYTDVFVKLTLLIGIIDSLRLPLNTSIHATGKIKKFQIFEGGLSLFILPIAYVFLKIGFSPVSVFVVQLIMFMIIHITRILIVCPAIKMNMMDYFKNVIFDSIKIFVPVILCVFYVKHIMTTGFEFFNFVVICGTSILLTLIFTYIWGLDAQMKVKIKSKICSKLKIKA